MTLRERGEDAWERLTAFARMPVEGGSAAYIAIGWWLRVVCWVLVALAAGLLIAVAFAIVGYATVVAMEPQGLADAFGLMLMTIAAAILLVTSLVAYLAATGLCFFVAFVYSAWISRRRSGLYGVRIMASAILLLGAAGVALRLSPFSLAVAVEVVTAFGLVVLVATWLPGLRAEFATRERHILSP